MWLRIFAADAEGAGCGAWARPAFDPVMVF